MRSNPLLLVAVWAIAMASLDVPTAAVAVAEGGCGPAGGPPPHAASQDVSAVYGQPATLWITNSIVGISTAQGYGEAPITSASPLQRSALLVDSRQDREHQIVVNTGRAALLYTVASCTITPVVDEHGAPFAFDIGHRNGLGDGVGCSDLGEGRRLVRLMQMHNADDPRLKVQRTAIDLTGSTASTGRSDTVIAASEQDPVWTSATDISCGDLTIARDGVAAPG